LASRRQIIANRRNAQRSTGPRTIAGKLRSRRNALWHGLTGETVITVFENAKDYEAFEQAVVKQYQPRTAIHRQLVLRLCSLLWRLQRATAIETGLFRIQGEIIRERRAERDINRNETKATTALYEMLGLELLSPAVAEQCETGNETELVQEATAPLILHDDRPQILAQNFMRVAHLDNQILERLNRYETALWRQAVQLIKLLT
jgi:hypothetical protein